MARVRIIEPGFFLNERLASLPPHARLLFVGLWQIADREGRLEDRPRRIKAEIFPWEDVAVDDLLWALASREGLRPKEEPFVIRYEVDGLPLLAIPNFLRHQKPHPREVKSDLPPLSKGKERKGSPKVDLGLTQGEPKVDLGPTSPRTDPQASPRPTQGEPRVNKERDPSFSEGGEPEANLGQTLGSPKDTPRLPVSVAVPVSVSVAVAHEKPTAAAAAFAEYLKTEWPEVPDPAALAKAIDGAYGKEFDLVGVARVARAGWVANGNKSQNGRPAAMFLAAWFKREKDGPPLHLAGGGKTRHGNGQDDAHTVPGAEETEAMLAELRKKKGVPRPKGLRV